MKKIVRLTESELMSLISRSARRMINEAVESFYDEEDDSGRTGRPGEVKSYDLGYLSVENEELSAEEHEMSLEDYLKYWWNEVSVDGMPFTWQKLGSGYGYHGDEICTIEQPDGSTVVFKDIYGQLMADAYAPGEY